MFALLLSPKGRIGRAQWWGVQIVVILAVCFAIVPLLMGPSAEADLKLAAYWPVYLIGVILLFWVNLCAIIKRYHDRGKSGWWYLICLVPTVGGIWQLIECGFLSGEPNDNQYGPAGGRDIYSPQTEFQPQTDKGGLPNRYDRAIEEAVLANRRAASSETVTTYQQPTQNYQPSNGRPVFGKRV